VRNRRREKFTLPTTTTANNNSSNNKHDNNNYHHHPQEQQRDDQPFPLTDKSAAATPRATLELFNSFRVDPETAEHFEKLLNHPRIQLTSILRGEGSGQPFFLRAATAASSVCCEGGPHHIDNTRKAPTPISNSLE